VHDVGILGVHTRVLGVLVLCSVARVVLVENVVVVDECIGRAGEKFQDELLDFGVEYALDFRRILEVRAFGFEMR
jgi:hypothetical protein